MIPKLADPLEFLMRNYQQVKNKVVVINQKGFAKRKEKKNV